MSGDQCIVRACEDSWEGTFIAGIANKDNCSGFIKAVAQRLNVPMSSGNADAIVSFLAGHESWKKLDSGSEAKTQAETGHLVLAGLKSGDHSGTRNNGHVVVVVGGMLYRGKYPKCWGGSIGSAQSRGVKSVGEVWNTTDRDSVVYYYYAQGSVCTAH
jgi:hypothetical protein